MVAGIAGTAGIVGAGNGPRERSSGTSRSHGPPRLQETPRIHLPSLENIPSGSPRATSPVSLKGTPDISKLRYDLVYQVDSALERIYVDSGLNIFDDGERDYSYTNNASSCGSSPP